MTLIRWRPNHSMMNFRNEMDCFFDDFLKSSLGNASYESDSVWNPNMDILETENEVVATFELPGINKDDVKISIHEDILHIEGTKKQEKESKGEYYHRNERSYGEFKRSIKIPFSIESKKIKAKFRDGVVKIELPKAPEAKVKEIPISID